MGLLTTPVSLHTRATKKRSAFATAEMTCDYEVGMSSSLHQMLGASCFNILHKYMERKNVLMSQPVKKKRRQTTGDGHVLQPRRKLNIQDALMPQRWKLFSQNESYSSLSQQGKVIYCINLVIWGLFSSLIKCL